MEKLIVRSISKSYKRGKKKANKNISISFIPGEISALTGHNGAGKTTLLQQIMGINKPDQGSITYRGHSFITEPFAARNMISMMPQFHAPLSGVTLKQAIEAILMIRGIQKQDRLLAVRKILSDLQIEDWATVPGEKLSGGLQRLTSFAMTVVAPPPILLFDEPTNDVDPVRRKVIWQYLRMLADQGHIIIVVTHNLLEVEQNADRFLLLDHGELLKNEKTSLLKSELLTSSLLRITCKKIIKNSDFPSSFEVVADIDGELNYEIHLINEQVESAVKWLFKMVDKGLISHYDLSPYPLEALYKGVTNARKK